MTNLSGRPRRYHVAVLLTVAVALGLILAAILWVGASSGLFRREGPLYTAVPTAEGLLPGSDVLLAGVQVGTVEEIDLPVPERDGLVPIEMSVDVAAIRRMGPESRAVLRTSGLVGQRVIAIDPRGPDEPPLEPRAFIPHGEEITVEQVVETSLARVNQAMDQVDAILEQTGAAVSKLRVASSHIQAIAQDVASAEGTLGALIQNREPYEDLSATLANLRALTRTMQAGEGSLGRLIQDPAIARQLDSAAQSLNALVTRINEGEGTLGRLIVDPRVAIELNQTLNQLNRLVEDMRENPGKYFKVEIF